MHPSLRLCALTVTLALLAPLPGVEDPTVPTPPPVTPVTTPVTPAPIKAVKAVKATPVAKPLAAVPTDAAQADALKTLKNAFKDEYAPRRKPEDRQAFARVLLEQGRLSLDDVERFVVLSEASTQAAKAGDQATVLTAQDELAAHYAVPAHDLRLTALSELAPNLPSAEAAHATVDAMLLLAEDGMVRDDYAFTFRACKEADILARRLNSAPQSARIKTIAERAKELAEEFKKVGEVEDLLGFITPEAHLRLGQFLCFAKGDWALGLPHLAECSDATLKAAAANELAATSDQVDTPAKVADRWYDVGQKQRNTAKEETHVHALMWYRRAAHAVKGAAKLKIDKRIDDLERALEASGRSVRYPAGAAVLLTFERETLSGQGTTVTYVLDTSGHNLRANATGPLTVEAGSYGLALKSDGKSWLTVSDSKDLQITGNHTIAFWMRPDALGVRRNPFDKTYNNENSMVLEIDGALNYLYGNDDSYQVLTLPAAGVPKRWTHVALVRDFTARRLVWFKDGKKETETVTKYTVSAASAADQKIGSGYCSPFLGLLDDVGLWPRALSEAEIRQLYDATSAGR